MPISRRMHPSVCRFISQSVYDSRLDSDEGAAAQRLVSAGGESLVDARLVAVAHAGRSQVCPEEIAAIEAAICSLVGSTFSDRDGKKRLIGHDDILVVAPYNAQVNALREALPAAVRVGDCGSLPGAGSADLLDLDDHFEWQ